MQENLALVYDIFDLMQCNTRVLTCRQNSDISRTLVSNTIFDHSDVAGAPSVGAAPAALSIST